MRAHLVSYTGMVPFVECLGYLHLESLHLGYNQISPAMCKMLNAAADRCEVFVYQCCVVPFEDWNPLQVDSFGWCWD